MPCPAARIEPQDRDLVRTLARSVIEGDPRDPDVLRAASVAEAQAVVLTDDDDVANIHTALVAGRLHPGIHLVLVATRRGLAAAVLRGVARAHRPPAAAPADGGTRG